MSLRRLSPTPIYGTPRQGAVACQQARLVALDEARRRHAAYQLCFGAGVDRATARDGVQGFNTFDTFDTFDTFVCGDAL